MAVNVNEDTTGTLINLAQVSSDTNDSNPNNNSVIEATTVFADPPDTVFNEIVSIFQTFSIQVIKPILPEPFVQAVSIVQDFSVQVFSALNPAPFNQMVSIVQDFSVQVFSSTTPPAFSQPVTINQDFTIEVIPDETTITGLIESIETFDLDPGIENALLAPLKNIEFEQTNSKDQMNQICGKLGAFINKVNALSEKKLSVDQAESFIDLAERIKENFGC